MRCAAGPADAGANRRTRTRLNAAGTGARGSGRCAGLDTAALAPRTYVAGCRARADLGPHDLSLCARVPLRRRGPGASACIRAARTGTADRSR